MNFSALFKEFLLAKSSSKVTVKNYVSDVNRFIVWFEKKYQQNFSPEEMNSSVLSAYEKEGLAPYSASSAARNLSSLRKFFTYLKLEGHISHSPFEAEAAAQKIEADPWRIKDFKNHLYVFNASHLTIKNYIIDVKQFLSWAETVLDHENEFEVSSSHPFDKINSKLIEEYKARLMNEARLSPVSVNRKLSSIRRYISWAQQEGIIRPDVTVPGQTRLIQETDLSEQILPAQQPQVGNAETVGYSWFPPLRLAQKAKNGVVGLADGLIIFPLLGAVESAEQFIWKKQGKPVTSGTSAIQALINSRQKTKSSSLKIKNVPKSFYAPAMISTKYFPLHKKVWHHVRNTRPNWYRKYQNTSAYTYFRFAIIVLFVAALSYALYSYVNPNKKQAPTLAAGLPNAPNRILSFQGRLTDASDNPITSSTALRMAIYSNSSASGSALVWQEIVTVTPDNDGIFSTLLGNNTAIGQEVFANYKDLWLGVTVGQTPELTPRQQIATVGFATNAEFLQGLPPITNATNSANVVLALNSSGNLVIGNSSSPTFQATGGTFTLAGQSLVLNTNTGSAGNITLAPDGLGKIDFQKPLQNTSDNNNLTQLGGGVEIDDNLGVLASASGAPAFLINQTSTGDLIDASTSGTTKFRVDSSGNLNIAGAYSIGGTQVLSSNTLGSGVVNSSLTQVGALNSGSITSGFGSIDTGADNIVTTGTVGSAGTTAFTGGSLTITGALSANGSNGTGSQCLLGGATASWGACSTGGGSSPFTTGSGAIFPLNNTQDFLLGGQATTSAKFAVLNIAEARGTQVASISGNIVLDAEGSIEATNNQTLSIGGNETGDVVLVGNGNNVLTLVNDGAVSNTLYLNSGKVAVGGTTTTSLFNVGASAEFQVDSSGNVSSTGTTGVTLTGTGAGITFATGTGNHDLEATAGTLRFGAATLTGTITGGNQNISSIGNITANSSSNTITGFGTVGTGGTTAFLGTGLNATGTSDTSIGNSTGTLTLTSNGGLNVTSGGAVTGVSTLDMSGQLTTSTIDSSGTMSIGNSTATTITIGRSGQSISLPGYNSAGGVLYSNSGTLAMTATGTSDKCLTGGSTPTWVSCFSASGNLWTTSSDGKALIPINSTMDLLLGGTATSSSKFAFVNLNSGTPTFKTFDSSKTKSVNIYHDGTNGNIETSAGNLNLGTSGGNIYIDNSIVNDTTNNSGSTSVADKLLVQNTETAGTALAVFDNLGAGDILTASKSGTTKFVIDQNGNIGIGGNANSSNYINSPNFVLTTSGTITTGTWNGTALTDAFVSDTLTSSIFIGSGSTSNAVDLATAEVNGTLGSGNGGTGFSTYTQGDLIYASATNTLSKLAISGSNGLCLTSNGTTPSWGSCGSATNYFQRIAGNVSPVTLNDTISATSSASTVATFTSNNPAGTLTQNTLIQNTGAGTATSLLTLSRTAGTVTNGLNFSGTMTQDISFRNGDTLNNSAAGTLALSSSTLTASSLATLTTSSTVNWGTITALNFTSAATTLTIGSTGNGTIEGSTANNGNLTLEGTTSSTRTTSNVLIQPNGGFVAIGRTSTRNSSPLLVESSSDIFQMITSRFSTANGDTASLAFRISNDSNPDDTIKAAIFFQRTAAGNGRGDLIIANDNTANSSNVTTGDVGITIAAGGGITMPNVSAGTTTGSMCMSSAGVVFFNTGTNACISSTRSSKHDINYIENMGLEQILNLNPVTYIYNDDSANRTRLGFIAEDVAAINPLFASYGSNGLPNGLSDYGIEAASVQAIKDLNSKVDLATGSANTHILNLEKDLSLTTDGNLAVIPTVDTDFKVQNSGKDVTRVGAFAILVVAKIRAGIVNAQEIATNSLSIATDNITVSGQRLSDYIGTIVDQRLANYNGGSNNNQIAVNIISPLDQSPAGKVTVKLNDNKGKSKLEIQNASGSAVASFDSAGNATLSGELSANGASISGQLSASDASVSGTLRAGHIIADDIDGLDARIGSLSATTIVNNNYYSTPSGEFNSGYNASGSGSFDSLFAKTAEFEQGLMSFGSSTFFEASVANRLFVGTQLSIADNSINVLGGNLRLQPLGSGGVSLVADKVQIDTDGNLTVNGNATFAKNVAVGGKLYTKVIAPFPNQDLSLELGSGSSQLQIKGASNSGVIAISNKGDLNASGAGTFNKLNLSFVPQALAVSDIEVVATGSAGTVTLNANKPEITIDNTIVTPDSLIYITPVGQTWGESIYLSRQVAGESFTVGISGPTDHDIKFNFLIIN